MPATSAGLLSNVVGRGVIVVVSSSLALWGKIEESVPMLLRWRIRRAWTADSYRDGMPDVEEGWESEGLEKTCWGAWEAVASGARSSARAEKRCMAVKALRIIDIDCLVSECMSRKDPDRERDIYISRLLFLFTMNFLGCELRSRSSTSCTQALPRSYWLETSIEVMQQ